MSDRKQPKILIVGTQPYNKTVQSRAFDSYFHFHLPENTAQIFSDGRTPCKGHCGTLYQITDSRLLKARRNKADPGIIFQREELPDSWDKESGKPSFAPKHKPSLIKLIRKWIWKKKLYQTSQLNRWLDEFHPDLVFLSFSRDFFIFDLAFYVADRFSIPIIASTADDFIFDQGFTLSPFTWIYRSKYNRYIKSLLSRRFEFMFESEKIQTRYQTEFSAPSFIQYICTELSVSEKPRISDSIRSVGYFGNLESGRLGAILDVADAVSGIQPQTKIHIYSKDANSSVQKKTNRHPNVVLHEAVPYEEMLLLTEQMDALLIVESTKKRHVRTVRYSLSTKVADCLASGKPILAYGGRDTGAMDFLSENKCALVVTDKKLLVQSIRPFLEDTKLFCPLILNAIKTCRSTFDVNRQAMKFEENASRIADTFANKEAVS